MYPHSHIKRPILPFILHYSHFKRTIFSTMHHHSHFKRTIFSIGHQTSQFKGPAFQSIHQISHFKHPTFPPIVPLKYSKRLSFSIRTIPVTYYGRAFPSRHHHRHLKLQNLSNLPTTQFDLHVRNFQLIMT